MGKADFPATSKDVTFFIGVRDMKRTFRFAALGVVGLLFLFSGSLWAQGAVINGDFETNSLAPMWSLTGGTENIELLLNSTKPGLPSICLRRELGPSTYDGGIEQMVYLMGGVTYIFSADIAAQYCAS